MLGFSATTELELKFVPGIIGHNRHNASGGGLSKIERLGPLQHLQLSHIHIGIVYKSSSVHDNPVEVNRDGVVKRSRN